VNTEAPPSPGARVALAQLFADLRREGFRLRPDDYVEVQRVLEAFQPQTPDDVRALIAPLLVTSEAEQEKFDRIFAASFREIELPVPTVKPPKPERHLPWGWLVGGLPALGLLGYVAFLWPAPTVTPNVTLSGAVGPFQVGDTLRFAVDSSLRRGAGRQLDWSWRTSDDQAFPQSSEIAVVARRAGNLTVTVRANAKRGLLFPTTERQSSGSLSVPVCAVLPTLKLDSTRMPGGPPNAYRYRYAVTRLKPEQPVQALIWTVNGAVVARNVRELTYSHRQSPVVSAYDVRVQAFPDTTQGLCFGEASLSVSIPGTNETPFTLAVRSSGAAIQPATRVKTPFRWATWLLGLAAAAATALYFSLIGKDLRKRPEPPPPPPDSNAENPLSRFDGDEPPLEIPFENREASLIVRDEAFHEVVRTLRQRTEEETTRLHVPATLRATLREGGFPTLVFQPRLAEVEYLFLIDRSQVRSQQVALFEYLFRAFCRENVGIERFFFHQKFDRFTNESQPNGLTLRQLTDTYRSRTLVVWGNGYPLLYPAYPVVEPAYREALAEFAQRAVLTPVPFADWGQKERALQAVFLLLPADLAGQVRLMRALAEGKTRQDAYLRQQAADFYAADDVDFRDVDELAAYLADEGLMQWLGAVALYPRLRWEVVVEMGRAVLPPERVNFSNLLKLVRIRWMHEGSLPDRTRLDLLKRLTPENEVKAREALLRMLDHAERYFPGQRLFGEEKYLLQTTNRFTLYAHDRERYADFAPALKEFRTLRENRLLPDRTMVRYLENEERAWDTALNQRAERDLTLDKLQREIAELKAEEARLRAEGEAAFRRGDEEAASALRVSRKAVSEQLAAARRKREERQANRQTARTTLDGFFAALPPDEPTTPLPPSEKPRDPRRIRRLVTALGLLLAWGGVWLFTQTPRARELALDQAVALTVALDTSACVTARNTSATDDPRWSVYLNDSLYSISNLHATRSFSLGSLFNVPSGSTGGGWGDETVGSGIQNWLTRTFAPARTDAWPQAVTVAVRDTGNSATQYQNVALTGDTVRVAIACRTEPLPPKSTPATKSDSTTARLRVDVFYLEGTQATTQPIARKLVQGLQTSAQYDVQLKLLRTKTNQQRYYLVSRNEIRFDAEERPQALQLKAAAEAILRTEKITFAPYGVSRPQPSKNYVSLFVFNSPQAGTSFVCQLVDPDWLGQFDGWQGTYSDYNYSTPVLNIGPTRSGQYRLGIAQQATVNGRTSTVQDTDLGTSSRICQQNGIYIVQTSATGSGRVMLFRNVTNRSCQLALVTLDPTALNGPQGQTYFDRLVRGALFSTYSAPSKTAATANDAPAQNAAPVWQRLGRVQFGNQSQDDWTSINDLAKNNPSGQLRVVIYCDEKEFPGYRDRITKVLPAASGRILFENQPLNPVSQNVPTPYAEVFGSGISPPAKAN
jgi:hypothetical protein